MKVLVTAKGLDENAPLDPRFGRAVGFVLVDTETGEVRGIDNSEGMHAVGGAGIKAAEMVSRLGAESVVTGHCGPKAFSALQAAGIGLYSCASGTVADAVARLEAGELPRVDAPDVRGHWM
jgi:predicted Fe-Mo cluster-binding NifX family protein